MLRWRCLKENDHVREPEGGWKGGKRPKERNKGVCLDEAKQQEGLIMETELLPERHNERDSGKYDTEEQATGSSEQEND